MSILILGGAGYIGSHTAHELSKTNTDIIIADNLQTGHLDAIPAKAKFYMGDIRDKSFLDKIFETEKIDAIIHFAASSLVRESIQNPLKYYENNLIGTFVLLKSMIEHNINNIVFSSTAAVYGEPQNIPIKETDRTEPANTYGETKFAMEKMFKWVSNAHNISYVSLRYFNACGANLDGNIGEDHNPETHLIPIILQTANGQREKIQIFGDDYDTKDGTCIRDYIHVCDLAQAHILAVDYLLSGGKSDIFNLGNGEGFSVKEIINTARKVTSHPIEAIITKRRAGDPSILIADSSKARSVLNWKPKYTKPDEIISTAWKWHKSHPYGYIKVANR